MLQPQIRSHSKIQCIILTLSPKPLFDRKGKIKLQLHTFLPMMSWKCMLTAWSTDCSASKVINPKPSQRPRVNQGSRGEGGLWQHKMKNSIGLQQSEDPSRNWARGSWGSDDVADTNPRLMPGGLRETFFFTAELEQEDDRSTGEHGKRRVQQISVEMSRKEN